MPPRKRLPTVLALLAKAQGERAPKGPPRDPWHAILRENVVYLAGDAQRDAAFAVLRAATGLDAATIAEAPDEVLLPICGRGRMAELRVAALRECAEAFASAGDPRKLVKLPPARARKALRAFPGIGEPGADRLLLFAGAAAVTAVESNGLRTLLRLGYGTAAKSYGTSYRSAVAAADAELPAGDCEARIDAYLRLRRHGAEVCRERPQCSACALARRCPSAARDAAR